jgi:hypothetical protein
MSREVKFLVITFVFLATLIVPTIMMFLLVG